MSKFCQRCGNELPDDAQFCIKCGYNFSGNNNMVYTVPQGSSPLPVKKKGGCLKGLIIILGSLIVFIIIIFIAVGNSDDEPKASSKPSNNTTIVNNSGNEVETVITQPIIDEPDKEITTTAKNDEDTTTSKKTTTKQTEKPKNDTPAETETSNNTVDEKSIRKAVNDGDYSLVTPEFKESMDAYEECMDEYINMMYNSDKNNDMEMLMNMGTILEKQQEWSDKIDAIDETKLSPADDAYYLIVSTRVAAKLLKYSATN